MLRFTEKARKLHIAISTSHDEGTNLNYRGNCMYKSSMFCCCNIVIL